MNQNTGGFVISDYKVFYSPQKPQSADLYVAVWWLNQVKIILPKEGTRDETNIILQHLISTRIVVSNIHGYPLRWGETAKQVTAKETESGSIY